MADRRDARLLAGLRRGDIEALEQTWHLWSHRVFSFLWRMCRDVDEAEALTEEAFAALWRGAMMVDDDRPLVLVLLRIAYRALIQHEKDATEMATSGADASTSARHSAVVPTADAGDAEAALTRAMLGIPAERLAPFVLLVYQGMRVENVALVLGLSEQAVQELAVATEAELREALKPQLAAVGGSK